MRIIDTHQSIATTINKFALTGAHALALAHGQGEAHTYLLPIDHAGRSDATKLGSARS